MENFDYVTRWNKKELNKFKADDFRNLGVNDSTIEFLTTVGLPKSTAPFLAFDRLELKTIRELYETEDPACDFLIDIGSDGTGDPICIDIKNHCEIVALNHEDNFAKRFANTSVIELFAFLTIYKEFTEDLIGMRGEEAFIESNFKDEEVEGLIKKLKSVDRKALKDNTFWSGEIAIFIANREVR